MAQVGWDGKMSFDNTRSKCMPPLLEFNCRSGYAFDSWSLTLETFTAM